MDAEAVRYNFERWWDPAHPNHSDDFEYFVFIFNGFKGDPDCLISAINTLSSDQVQIILSQPFSLLPSALAFAPFAIASPGAIQSGTLSTDPVGSEPFKFVEWEEEEHIRLAGSNTYWGDGPYLESLTFQVIASDAERYAALQANTVQGYLIEDLSYVPTATLDTNLQVLWRPALNTGTLGINWGHAPLDNDLVRQSIAHAIDKQSLIDNYFNDEVDMGKVSTQFLPPTLWGFDHDLVDYAYDPVQSIDLLAQAGYTDGFTTTLWIRDVYRSYLPDAVGITATLEVLAPSDLIAKIRNGENDLFMLGWGLDYTHPDNLIWPHFCDESNHSFGPQDDTLCSRVYDPPGRTRSHYLSRYVWWISQRIHDTLPMIPIGHGRTPLLFRKNVTGFIPSGVGGGMSFKDVFLVGDSVSITKLTPSQGSNDVPVSLDPDSLETFGTGVHYQLTHALALLTTGRVAILFPTSPYPAVAGWLFIAGTLFFSGSLYLIIFTNKRWFGAIAPLGGLALIVGWMCLGLTAL